jgi:hypothetical protein
MMAELVNGYITVRTGLVEANAVPPRRVPRNRRRASDAELRDRVHRLRRDGWSYRRIAATLELRYTLVAEILDGPATWVGDYQEMPPAITLLPPPEPVALLPVDAPRTAVMQRLPVASDAAVEAVLQQQARLADKVDVLLRASEQQRNAISRLETSLLGSIRAENARLADRVIGGVKALLERLLPALPRHIDPPAGE